MPWEKDHDGEHPGQQRGDDLSRPGADGQALADLGSDIAEHEHEQQRLDDGAADQSRTSEPRRNGPLPRGQEPCPAGCGSVNQLDGFYVLLAAADWVRAGAARRDGAVGDRLALGVCLPGLRDHFHEDGLGAVRASHLC